MKVEKEVKVLNIDLNMLTAKLVSMHAEKISETRLVVNWFRPVGEKLGEENWYLRVRSYSTSLHEVTWKGISTKNASSRSHKEINFTVSDPDAIGDLFNKVGLEQYAHQEKDRVSWIYKDWKFDLDQYPEMPAYLEIEGNSDESIQEAIQLLGLERYEVSTEGERVLITDKYNLNWLDMRF